MCLWEEEADFDEESCRDLEENRFFLESFRECLFFSDVDLDRDVDRNLECESDRWWDLTQAKNYFYLKFITFYGNVFFSVRIDETDKEWYDS